MWAPEHLLDTLLLVRLFTCLGNIFQILPIAIALLLVIPILSKELPLLQQQIPLMATALNEHVARALAANRDVRLAVANLDAARANSRLAGAARTPDVVLESGASPTTRGANQPSTTGVPKSSYELGAEAV